MAGTYEFYITNDKGVRIAPMFKILGASITIADGLISSAQFDLPPTFDTDLIQPDYFIQPWRKPDGGPRSLLMPYFIRRWRFETSGGTEVIRVWGRGPNELLRRRIVAAYKGTSAAYKSLDYADDAMKEYCTQQFADGVDPAVDEGTRVLSGFSVAADLSAGPLVSYEGSFKKLLTKSGGGVLGALKKASREQGTEVFFSVAVSNITSSTIEFQFRTKTGQPGQDVSSSVVFSQSGGNLVDPFLEYDYTPEENYIYGVGAGTQSGRDVQQAADAARYNISKWARIEDAAEAKGQDKSDDAILTAARNRLEQGRPLTRMGGKVTDTGKYRFGIDWNIGDKVTQSYRGQEGTAIIRSGTIKLDRNMRETISARLDITQ